MNDARDSEQEALQGEYLGLRRLKQLTSKNVHRIGQSQVSTVIQPCLQEDTKGTGRSWKVGGNSQDGALLIDETEIELRLNSLIRVRKSSLPLCRNEH